MASSEAGGNKRVPKVAKVCTVKFFSGSFELLSMFVYSTCMKLVIKTSKTNYLFTITTQEIYILLLGSFLFGALKKK